MTGIRHFVSADDVATLVALAVNDESLRNRMLTIPGPENLSFNQVIELIRQLTGVSGTVRHVPLPAMRIMSAMMALLKPGLAREIKAGIFLDTTDRTTNAAARADYPAIQLTTMAQAILARKPEPILRRP
jgi:nucleoside-diphosphate-sugar epimerase